MFCKVAEVAIYKIFVVFYLGGKGNIFLKRKIYPDSDLFSLCE